MQANFKKGKGTRNRGSQFLFRKNGDQDFRWSQKGATRKKFKENDRQMKGNERQMIGK